VNGVPASGVTLANSNMRAIFTYDVSPVVSQGVQSMNLAANAVNRASDNDGNDPFTALFRYDALQLRVASTNPAPFPNGAFTLPGPFTFDVNFNEPVRASRQHHGALHDRRHQ
jgi:hypothetical protein